MVPAVFEEMRGRQMFYYPNIGNAGDSLIAAATYQLFRAHQIKAVIRNDLDVPATATVVLGGGGNFVGADSFIGSLLDHFAERGNPVILLPHTIRGNEALLARLPSSVTLLCRDEPSYRHVRGCASRCQVAMAHDLALSLDPAPLLRSRMLRQRAEPLYRQALRHRAGLDPDDIRGREVFCIREDAEKTIAPPARNYDISHLFFGGLKGVLPGHAEIASWMMLDFVGRAGRVITNRLHVGMAAALLGVETRMFDNANGKVGAVYHHSMAGRWPTARFVDTAEILDHLGIFPRKQDAECASFTSGRSSAGSRPTPSAAPSFSSPPRASGQGRADRSISTSAPTPPRLTSRR